MKILRKFVKQGVEPLLASTVGKLLWSPVSVSVLAHGDHGDVLVLESDGSYELPGGCVKAGETLKEAGEREVMEETGCRVEIGDLLEISREKGRTDGVHFFFEADVAEADLNGTWEGNPEFVDKEEVKDLEWKLHHSHVEDYLFPDS